MALTAKQVGTAAAAAVFALGFAAVRDDVADVIRYALAVRERFGLAKGFAFAVAMRLAYMPAFPDVSIERSGFVAFDGGYEQRPAPNGGGGDGVGSPIGVLFLPGALVDPAAYAPLLRRISSRLEGALSGRDDGPPAAAGGPVVVCAEYPALRNPVVAPFEGFLALLRRHPGVGTWIVAGHSMGSGSYGAAGFVSWLLEQKENEGEGEDGTSVLPTVGGLAMLAGTITGDSVDLSGAEGLEVLALLASEDTIVPPEGNSESGEPVRDGIDGRCPPATTETFVVEGGNHAGFGHYGPQRFPFADGERTIGLEEQQEIVAARVLALAERVLARK